MKLHRKIILLLSLLTLTCLVPIGWLTYGELKHSAKQRLFSEITAAVELLSEQIDARYAALRERLAYLERHETIADLLGLHTAPTSADAGGDLSSILPSTRRLPRDVIVLTPGGETLLDTVGDTRARPELIYNNIARRKQDSWASLAVNQSGGGSFDLLAARRLRTKHKPAGAGYLITRKVMSIPQDALRRLATGNPGLIVLTDKDGVPLAHHPLTASTNSAGHRQLYRLPPNQRDSLNYQGEMHYVYTRETINQHILWALLPQRAVAESAHAYSFQAVRLAVIAVLIGIVFVLLALKWMIVNPINRLAEAAAEIGNGNLLPSIELDSKDEFADLARSLREMGQNLRQSNEQIRYFAYHDNLTKLPNRLMFSEYLERALSHAHRRGQSVGLMFLDLDDFKRVNDTLGHQAGDEVLREVAKRLSLCLRADDYVGRPSVKSETDTVARLGGDEFTIFLPDLQSPYQAGVVASRVLAALSCPFLFRGHEVHLSASIGITIYPKDGADVATLVKNADMAMYHAKESGKNVYKYFREAMNRTAIERMSLENELRKALDNDELVLHYQPQVELHTGNILAVEALVRWLHPEKGLIPPDDFIPFAEENGLIVPIGEWVMRNACIQNQKWRRTGYGSLTVSVNVSGAQFRRQNLKKIVQNALHESGLPAQYLEIELTETSVIDAEDVVINTLRQLKALGVRIAMDDFGTGYSSLSFLRKLPIDKLKVDRSFVNGITSDRSDAAIITAIIAMAQGLDLPVTAEGVELQAQIDFLRDKGCALIQGFFISKPVSAQELIHLLAKKQLTAA